MSNAVAPLPTGTGVLAITEHRQRRDPESRQSQDGETSAGDQAGSEARAEHPAPHGEVPPAMAEDETLPAETLFAAALFANEFPRQPPSADELKLRTAPGWTPPESSLHLKDKLI